MSTEPSPEDAWRELLMALYFAKASLALSEATEDCCGIFVLTIAAEDNFGARPTAVLASRCILEGFTIAALNAARHRKGRPGRCWAGSGADVCADAAGLGVGFCVGAVRQPPNLNPTISVHGDAEYRQIRYQHSLQVLQPSNCQEVWTNRYITIYI